MPEMNNTASLESNFSAIRPAYISHDFDLWHLGISRTHLVRPIDEDYVSELAETDEAGWDLIEVRWWPDEWPAEDDRVRPPLYHVVSGNHRTMAARLKGLKKIRGRQIDAPDDLSYYEAAIRTNSRHGRNFKEDERRVLAEKLKRLGKSSNDIANLFGVSKATVNNWLSGRDSNASKKARAEQLRKAADAIEMAGLDPEWRVAPAENLTQKEAIQIRLQINNFLAGIPNGLDPAQVIAWVHSHASGLQESPVPDIKEAIRWLNNLLTVFTN